MATHNCKDLQLQNRISTPKQKNDDFEAFLKGIFKGKLSLPKLKKSAAKAPFQRLTLPVSCDLRLSAPKHNSITHAAAATMNFHAAIPMRSADTELQNTIEWQHTTATICSSKTGDLDAKAEKSRF